MCVRKEGGNRRSCVHEGQSSIRWVFFSLSVGFQDETISATSVSIGVPSL